MRWNSFLKKNKQKSDRKIAQSVQKGCGQDGLTWTGKLPSQRKGGDTGFFLGLAAVRGGKGASDGSAPMVALWPLWRVHCRQWASRWIKMALSAGAVCGIQKSFVDWIWRGQTDMNSSVLSPCLPPILWQVCWFRIVHNQLWAGWAFYCFSRERAGGE